MLFRSYNTIRPTQMTAKQGYMIEEMSQDVAILLFLLATPYTRIIIEQAKLPLSAWFVYNYYPYFDVNFKRRDAMVSEQAFSL